jgi:HEAT repeat protein/S1-C subfamily serine protease
MIEFSCPKCRTVLETSPQQAGKVIKCPECGTGLKVPMPKKAPTAQETGIKQSPGKAIPPAGAKPQRPDKRPSGSRRTAKEESARGPSPALLIASVVGGVAVLAIIGVVLVLVLRSASKDSTETKSASAPSSSNPPVAVKGPAVNNSTPNLLTQTKKDQAANKDDPGPPDVTSSMDTKDIYRRTLQSVVWIVVMTPNGFPVMGSGSLVDRPNRIVLTNFHVIYFDVTFHTKTLVFFPMYEKDKLVTEKERYMRRRDEDGIPGTVVATDLQHDLALVQLSRVPDDVKAIPLADTSVSSLETVYSVGSPGASNALWGSTSGTVRQVHHNKWPVMLAGQIFELDSQVVEATNPVNPGDSGGPLINDRAELVGVAESISRVAQNMSIFIDVSEARNFIETSFQKKGWQWTRGEAAVNNHAGVPDLVRYLDSPNKDFRTKAIANLGKIGSGARLAVPDLIQVLKKEADGGVRRQAVEALNKIGVPEKKDLQLLTAGLSDTNSDVRGYAATALGKLGREGRIYIADLLKAKKDTDSSVRQAVIRSLGQVGRIDKEIVMDALKEGLKDNDKDVRVAAAESIVLLGPSAQDIPVLKDCLKHPDSEVQIAGARALWGLGPEAKDAVAPLMEALNSSKDDQVRGAIVTTLGQIGAASKSAVPAILETMKVKEIRPKAILALAKIGPEAKEAVPVLTANLEDRDSRIMAIKALGEIGKEAKVAVTKMTQLLAERDKDLRLTILTALKEMGPAAKEAVPAIGNCLDFKDKEVSLQALEVLGGLGPDAKAAVGDIIRLFLDEDTSPTNTLRGKAVDTLAKIGKPAVQRVHQALKQSNKFVRIGAAQALGQIGPDAKEATSSLRQMSNSPDPLLHQAADDALFKIQKR